jgi:hypothetical protein
MQFNDLKNLKRFREIAAVLLKYGLDEIVQRLELPGIGFIRKMSPIDEELDYSERIRRALEELGPSFVKFGQILSLRPDLLPGDLVNELEKLQEDVSAVELPEIKDQESLPGFGFCGRGRRRHLPPGGSTFQSGSHLAEPAKLIIKHLVIPA